MAIERLFTFKDGSTADAELLRPRRSRNLQAIRPRADHRQPRLREQRARAQARRSAEILLRHAAVAEPQRLAYSDTLIVEDPNATYEEILGPNEGPSKCSFVSTDVRDAILMMLPSLVRIFAASENVISPRAAHARKTRRWPSRRPTTSTMFSGRTTPASSPSTARSRTRSPSRPASSNGGPTTPRR